MLRPDDLAIAGSFSAFKLLKRELNELPDGALLYDYLHKARFSSLENRSLYAVKSGNKLYPVSLADLEKYEKLQAK